MLFTALGVLDMIRGRILVRIGGALDETLSGRVYDTLMRLPLKHRQPAATALQPLRDLDTVRSFLSGLGPIALFDLPWMPIYLAICFAFHPSSDLTALVGAIVLIALTLLTEILMRAPTKAATQAAIVAQRARRSEPAQRRGAHRHGHDRPHCRTLERGQHASTCTSQQEASDVAGGFGAISKVLRMMLQSGVLAVGAYLVINQEATAGIIIAGSILSARALAPVDLAIANWKGFVAARQSWQRLNKLLTASPGSGADAAAAASAAADGRERQCAPPGVPKIVVQDVTFELEAGNGLGIIGPSGSGKSSLARLLVGVWQPVRGNVRLDGAALDQWSPESLGHHIGYLPQDVELLAGTVAQNIARFEPQADNEAVIAAAKAAGVHDLIVGLPDGYETQVGEQGTALSAGQAQRIALARALYRDPFLVVLDEPNSNLDAEGDEALTQAILGVRERGGIVVVVAHRPSAIAGVDLLLMMSQGPHPEHSARRTKCWPKCCNGRVPAPRPLKVVPDSGSAKRMKIPRFMHVVSERLEKWATELLPAAAREARATPSTAISWPAA